MHLLLRRASRTSDARLARRAQAEGLAAEPLSPRAIRHDCGQGLLVGFTNVAEHDAAAIAQRLKHALGCHLPG